MYPYSLYNPWNQRNDTEQSNLFINTIILALTVGIIGLNYRSVILNAQNVRLNARNVQLNRQNAESGKKTLEVLEEINSKI